MHLTITEGSPEKAVRLLAQIPEFSDLYPLEEFQQRLQEREHLILLALDGETVVGCKVGYRLNQTCFYSWMGGVLPQWRRSGAARLLAEAQEAWAIQHGYTQLRFKTRNSCRAMLQFALKRGFNIIEVEPKDTVAEYRIWLEKALGE